MIVNIGDAIRSTAGLKAGLRYQLRLEPGGKKEPSKVLVLEGDMDRMVELSKTLSTSQKAIPILISFAESREELEEKLRRQDKDIADLYAEIRGLLFAGYNTDEVICSAIAHSDTQHFHIHMYVLNSFAGEDKTLRLHFGKGARILRHIEDFIDLRYGLKRARRKTAVSYTRKEELLRRLGKAKKYSRTALKEELNALITELVAMGQLRNAEDIRRFVEAELGGEIRRHGKNYMTIELEGQRIRLRGGIYDAGFERTKATDRGIPEGTQEHTQAEFERAKRELTRYIEQRTQEVQKRYGREREQNNAQLSGKRKVEIRTSGIGGRTGNQQEATTKVLGGNSRKGRKDIHSPTTLIQSYRQRAEAIGREAERIKREIDLRKLMSHLGLEYYHSNNYILARVPWRKDANPSFVAHLKDGKWLWIDLAKREGGSVIDFVMRFFSAGKKPLDFRGAMEWLKNHHKEIEGRRIAGTALRQDGTAQRIELIEDDELMKKVRQVWKLKYIPFWLKLGRRKYTQVKTRIGKHGEIEAFKVEKEGIMPVMVFTDGKNPRYWREIFPDRKAKGWLTQNTAMLMKHGNSGRLYIVEGYTDALAIHQIDPEADILILGTAQNAGKIKIPQNFEEQYEEIYIATDNDEAGEEAYKRLKKILPKAERLRYKGKDPMEAWLEGELKSPEEWEEVEEYEEHEIYEEEYEDWGEGEERLEFGREEIEEYEEEEYEEEQRKDRGEGFTPGPGM